MILFDEILGGQRVRALTLESLNERTTVREIIRARIWQEVQEHNAARRTTAFQGLVRPADHPESLNKTKDRFHPIDWEKQFAAAIRAFETNGFFLLIGDRQITDLDEEIDIEPETEVNFVKLVPLVGG